jgi:hypothetical protein
MIILITGIVFASIGSLLLILACIDKFERILDSGISISMGLFLILISLALIGLGADITYNT